MKDWSALLPVWNLPFRSGEELNLGGDSLPAGQNRSVISGIMIAARKVALCVNGTQMLKATLRRGEKDLELVIADPLIGEFVIDETFTLELLELVHPHEIRRRLPNGGWRRVSVRILIALLHGGVVRVLEEPCDF